MGDLAALQSRRAVCQRSRRRTSRPESTFAEYDYSNFYYGAGDDPLNLLGPFSNWYQEALPYGYYLYSEPLSTTPGTRVVVKNRKTGQQQELINMASYNYLGISYRPEVKEAAIKAIEKYGLGASGSPILSGTFDIHKELEAGSPRSRTRKRPSCSRPATAPTSGFISAIMRPGDNILLDQYSHASIVDGAILAKSNTVFFRHNNPLDLERKLGRVKGKKLVVVEGVYSMDGDVCVLPEIVEVAKRHGARILIDEAHSTFLFGQNGRGRGRTLRPRQGGRLPPRHLLQEPGRTGRLRVRQPRAHRLHKRLRTLALLLLQPGSHPGRGPAGRPAHPGARARTCARTSGATWPSCAAASAKRASTSASPTSQVMPVMVNNDPRCSRWRRRSRTGGSS